MKSKKDPRREIKELLAKGDLEKLLDKAAEIHGHYCSHVALGVRATYAAFRGLGIAESTGMEEILAIVECNNCFVDGIQAISGCTLGNNALIYKDLGKTAVTFINRKEKKAVRVIAKYDPDDMDKDPEGKEAMELFDRAVKKREKLAFKERERMMELWTKLSFAILKKPENAVLDVKKVKPLVMEYAPIFESIRCSVCGEDAVETRIGMKEKNPVCLECAGDTYWIVAGRGIHPVAKRIINEK
ncbi:MAG: formylmethanofuran dehydrogenase [Candidatus Omnitrophica bacterium]|nr:formylmethanofuran dehydrogenase [Candidatus Omnitrophota bacterium]